MIIYSAGASSGVILDWHNSSRCRARAFVDGLPCEAAFECTGAVLDDNAWLGRLVGAAVKASTVTGAADVAEMLSGVLLITSSDAWSGDQGELASTPSRWVQDALVAAAERGVLSERLGASEAAAAVAVPFTVGDDGAWRGAAGYATHVAIENLSAVSIVR